MFSLHILVFLNHMARPNAVSCTCTHARLHTSSCNCDQVTPAAAVQTALCAIKRSAVCLTLLRPPHRSADQLAGLRCPVSRLLAGPLPHRRNSSCRPCLSRGRPACACCKRTLRIPLRSTSCELWMGRSHRTRSWQSTFAGRWTAMLGWSHRSTRCTCALVVQPP